MKPSLGARKKAEALQLQLELRTDEDWQSVGGRPGLLVVDVYSAWCGPCSSMNHTLRKIKLELGDDLLTMATACADTISAFEKFRMKAEPTWLFFGGGKALRVVHGADGPTLVATIRELLENERALAKGRGSREVVMLESLVKPEEVIQPDEDLDDVEGQRAAREDEEEQEASEKPLPYAVVFILPHIVSTDRVEAFLSHMVAAGLVIMGHKQQELTLQQLHDLLYPPPPVLPAEEGATDQPGDTAPQDPRSASPAARGGATEQAGAEDDPEDSPIEDDLEHWEGQLSVAPLYMLLLRAEEADVQEAWASLLGPSDLDTARQQHPQSLVAEFGDEGHVVPAWMPRARALQQHLALYAFPALVDSAAPRLLLLPDTDHLQVLERLCSAGVSVLAHTQAELTRDCLDRLDADSQLLQQHLGRHVFAAVIPTEGASKIPGDLETLYLTPTPASTPPDAAGDEPTAAQFTSGVAPAADPEQTEHRHMVSIPEEIALFFPELAAELALPQEPGPLDDPQTQMQIEQRKESKV